MQRQLTDKVKTAISRCITDKEYVYGNLVKVINQHDSFTLVFDNGDFARYTIDRYDGDTTIEFDPMTDENFDLYSLKDLGLLTSNDVYEQNKNDKDFRELNEKERELNLLSKLKAKYENN
jgi:hypothetical protein